MYSIQQQCNTTTYFHAHVPLKKTSRINEMDSVKRSFQKLVAIMLIVQWLLLFLGSSSTSWNQWTSLNYGVNNVHHTFHVIPRNSGIIESKGALEYFEECEEIDEDLRKRIQMISIATVLVYRKVAYVVKPQKYFDLPDWKYQITHPPCYLKYCSFKIPSKFIFS